MAEQEKTRTQAETDGSGAEDRYRYIGFEVFPRRIREFWKSDTEKSRHLAHVKETGGKFQPLSRSNSIVAAQSLSMSERIILTFSSLLLIVSPLFPWFSFTRGDEKFVYSGFVMLLKAGSVLDFLSLGPGLLSVAFLLLAALMVISLLMGVLTLVVLYAGRGGDPEAYLTRLHRVLVLHYLPIAGWVTFFAVAASPTVIPFVASLGLSQVESSLNIASLASASTFGLWVPFATLWVNAIKGNDL